MRKHFDKKSNSKELILKGIIKCLENQDCHITYDEKEGYKISSIPKEKVLEYITEEEVSDDSTEDTLVDQEIDVTFKSQFYVADFKVKKTWKLEKSCKTVEKRFGSPFNFSINGKLLDSNKTFGELEINSGYHRMYNTKNKNNNYWNLQCSRKYKNGENKKYNKTFHYYESAGLSC
jgi:hypothetical protein